MEESGKKTIKIGAIALCLLAAIVVVGMNPKRGSSGLERIPSGDTVLIKCENAQCEAVYQMNKREYYALVDEVAARMPNTPTSPPPVACQECQAASARKAMKCTACGHVFFSADTPGAGADRCPECG